MVLTFSDREKGSPECDQISHQKKPKENSSQISTVEKSQHIDWGLWKKPSTYFVACEKTS